MGGFDTFWGFFDPGSGRWWLGLVSRTAVCFPKCFDTSLILECKTEPKAGLVNVGEAGPTSSQERSAWGCCPVAMTPKELSQRRFPLTPPAKVWHRCQRKRIFFFLGNDLLCEFFVKQWSSYPAAQNPFILLPSVLVSSLGRCSLSKIPSSTFSRLLELLSLEPAFWTCWGSDEPSQTSKFTFVQLSPV